MSVRPAPLHCKKNLAKKSQQRKAGLINGRRPRHVKRTKRNLLNIGTWNVQTLLQAGKLQELTEQIKKTKLEIVAVQETRWSETGIIRKNGFIFYYGGPNFRTGQAGTGFLIHQRIIKYVIGVEFQNERLSKLRLKGKFNNITLINVYAPTEEKTDEIKEQFYNDLQHVIDNIPKSDTIIVMGDFNAKLGKEQVFRTVSGIHTLHNVTSGNGELLCQFMAENNMIVMSTQFEHKRIHKGTWISPDHNTINQIDHVAINANKRDIIEDVKTMRGPNIDSDHFLVKTVINQKLPRVYCKKNPTRISKWNKQNLQKPSNLVDYKTLLYQKLKELPEENEINHEWNNIKTAIIEAATQSIKFQEEFPRNEWWDDECKQIINEKNQARTKAIQTKTRATQEVYKKLRTDAKRVCKQKKKHWINNKIKEIEENYNKKV